MLMNRLLCFVVTAVCAMSAVQAYAEVGFKSPTGNIVCLGDYDGTKGVECYIQKVDKATSKKPKGCQLDWGQLFFVSNVGKGQVVCHGDVPAALAYDLVQTLPYGKTIRGHGWRCTSQKTGMICKNNKGSGFSLSRASQKVF